MKTPVSVCWFRRDLRLEDNTAFSMALDGPYPVLPVFIFDKHILQLLPSRRDRRVAFIRQALAELEKVFNSLGSSLYIFHDTPTEAYKKLMAEFEIKEVYTNHDYEPYAIQRDEKIKSLLASNGIAFITCKDQVIYEKNEILKADGRPYTVFTPYAKAWKEKLLSSPERNIGTPLFNHPASSIHHQVSSIHHPASSIRHNLYRRLPSPIPSLEEIGFEHIDSMSPLPFIDEAVICRYSETRDMPSVNGTSGLSTHLRFGTVSIRQLVQLANRLSPGWLNELIWREFFMMILYHFPYVVNSSFKKKYDRVKWRNNEQEFDLWCRGETGYPLVDAGMRQLNETGWMHNRVRMVTAGFLTKHLLIDWRWGEAYFAEKLLDYELSSNNGNWQWSAGSGCDAALYFRVFNPIKQQEKFDPNMIYIKTWIPGYHADYLPRIVEHDFARKRSIQVYRESLGETEIDH